MKRLEHRVIAVTVASLAPLLLAIAWLLLSASNTTRWTVAIITVLAILILIAAIRTQINYPLRTLANLISALREEDYSIRARGAGRRDGMGELTRELNLLTDTLRHRRFGEVEAAALVRSVLEHIDSAIFTFDERWRLRLVNRAGERLLGRPAEQLHGRTAGELGVEAFSPARTRVPRRSCCREVTAAFAFAVRPFVRVVSRTCCFRCPISAAHCAKKSGKPGNGCCAFSRTS
jgi:PAS domain-containing protein